jgi:hypothetical protein
LGELDATELDTSDILKKFGQGYKPPLVIWFQCPWTYRIAQGYSTAKLLSQFIDKASTVKAPGGIVVVLGLVTENSATKRQFYGDYEIEELKETAKAKNFEHFEDRNFIRECILYGYRYSDCQKGSDYCHNSYLVNHVSHVFFKK